uniref:Uncharacterized protein LOC111120658 isoform X1 n=1 Tax=Crassostrea virginica TaxID=6565 RepID=A0A8B8CN61_CRAVI|nr:uncharacterized protein LOC111120658 isoform X1 [Crassostrea virginica]
MSTTSKCPENANVDQTGACQCNDGYITATCAEKCSNGTYGFACGKECTSCPWEQCNHITGCPLPGTTPPGGSTPSQNEIIIYITLLSSVVVLFSGLLLFRCCRGAKKMKRRNKKDEKSNVVQLMPGENSGIKGSANLYNELDDYEDEKLRVGDKVVLSVRPGWATAVYDTAEVSEESYSQIVLRSDILGLRTVTCESIDDTYNHLAINNITTTGIISEGQYGCVNDV